MPNHDIRSNACKWQHCTNRHTTTRGYYWGWIEGSPNITWSDDPGSNFNSAHASKLVSEHNKWLESLRSPELKLIDARNKSSSLARIVAEKKADLEKVVGELNEVNAIVMKLAEMTTGSNTEAQGEK